MFKRKYHHCGPFNSIKKPVGAIDTICHDHDVGYGKLGVGAYFKYNDYDDEFVARMADEPGLWPGAMNSFFKLKKKIMPAYGRGRSPRTPPSTSLTPYHDRIRFGVSPASRNLDSSSAGYSRARSVSRGRRSSRSSSGVRSMSLTSAGSGGSSRHVSFGGRAFKVMGGSLVSTKLKKNGGKRKYRRRAGYKRKAGGRGLFGVVSRVESMRKVQDLQAVYVGHSSWAGAKVLDGVVRAIVRAFWKKEGFTANEDGSAGPPRVTQFQIFYYVSSVSTNASFLPSSSLAAGATFATYVTVLRNLIEAVVAAASVSVDYDQLRWLEDAPVPAFAHCTHIKKTYLNGLLRSELKMQNVTANGAGSDSLDVTNPVPITYKTYSGNGNGTYMLLRSNMGGSGTYESFLSDPQDSYITVVAAQAVGSVLDEPPKPSVFSGCKGGYKKVLAPGAILTNVETTKFRMTLAGYLNMYLKEDIDSGIPRKISKGSFKVFGFEKVLQVGVGVTGVGTSTVKVEIDSEVDYKTEFNCVLGGQFPILPINTYIASRVIG